MEFYNLRKTSNSQYMRFTTHYGDCVQGSIGEKVFNRVKKAPQVCRYGRRKKELESGNGTVSERWNFGTTRGRMMVYIKGESLL